MLAKRSLVRPGAKLTWSRLRAQQACEQNAQQRQSEPTFEDGRVAAPKMRGTRASAWASFRSAESLQAQENQDLPHLSAADGHEDADALQLRLAALRAAAQCRKTEVEDLRRERQGVEETTQRYLRILQDFQSSV